MIQKLPFNLLFANRKRFSLVLMFAPVLIMAQTLTHSYTFETDASDVVGTAHGTLQGNASVSNGALQLAANGDYVSFDGAALALGNYTSTTQEFLFTVATSGGGQFFWQWTTYFGDSGGANSIMSTLGSWGSKDYLLRVNNDASTDAVVIDQSWDDGAVHHMVLVNTPNSNKMYRDGVLVAETTGIADTNIGTAEAFLGKGSSAWVGDPTWMGTIDEYNIYDGEMDAATVASRAAAYLGSTVSITESQLYFNESNTQLTFEVTGNGLIEDITLTPPAGVTLDVTTISVANSTTPTTVTATWDGLANIYNDLSISVTSGTEVSESISVAASLDSPCFTPQDAALNLIGDPTCMDRNNFGGWGNASTLYGYQGACGASSILMAPTDPNVWPDSAAAFNIPSPAWEANTQYGIMMKLKTVGGSVGMFLLNGGGDNYWDDESATSKYVNTNGAWVDVAYTFTTGAAPNGLEISINTLDGDLISNGAGTLPYATEVHIDNMELYNMTALGIEDVALTDSNLKVYPNPVQDVLQLQTNSDVSRVTIYDMLGRTVMSLQASEQSNLKTLDVSALNSGSYILHATVNGQIQAIKFLK